MRLKDKVALITGGSLGIGKAIAVKFAKEGAKLVIVGRKKESLEDTSEIIRQLGCDVLTIAVDVQHKEQVDSMIDEVLKKFGKIDVLVNNAGICDPKPFLEIMEDDWDQHMDINLKGTFLTSQRIISEWVQLNQAGSIINMSSVNGLQAEADQAHYNASKGGMNLLSMSMALEFAQHNIRVNSLCPGFIDTRLTQPAIKNEKGIHNILNSIPMNRVGSPEDIANAALFLATDDSSYMTGHNLVVDGGQVIKLA